MTLHRTFLELAAMAIDDPLTARERRHLDEHLAGCHDCVRSAAALRADATAIGDLPAIKLSERRGDQILAAVLRPTTTAHPLRLLAIAALLGLLVTVSIAVGAMLLQRTDDDLSFVVPVPSPTASPDPGPTASPDPSPSTNPVALTPWGDLAVTTEDQLQGWIEVVAPDGSKTRLSQGSNAAWLTAERIVFECVASPDPGEVCIVEAAGPGSVRIIASDAAAPAPAPDGRTIALRRGTIDVGSTWVVDADGSNLRELGAGRFSEWSPDGAWLAGQPDSPSAQVAIIRADGSGLRTLAPGYSPAWSPSGDRIAFLSSDDQGAASLRTVDVATGDVTVLYAPKGVELATPAWLGDRGWVFVQDGDVWRLDAGASDPVQLTTGLAIESSSATGDPLAVSADNRWVAFTTGIDTHSRVGIVSVDGVSGVSYPGKEGMSDPRWAPVRAPEAPASSSPAPNGTTSLGTAWTAAAIPVPPGRPQGRVEAVTSGGPGFVAVGRGCMTGGDQDACEAMVWTSTDGRTWDQAPASDATDTRSANSTSGPEFGMFDVTAGAPGIVAVGYAVRPNLRATIWFSPDGSSWERIPLGLAGSGTDPGEFMATRVNAVTWDGRSFVAVGEDRSDDNGRNLATAKARAAVWTSTDGRTWTRVPHAAAFDVGGFVDTGEDPSTGGIRDVAVGPGGLVAIGAACTHKPAGCKPAAWTSIDGTSWERSMDMPSVNGSPVSLAATDTGYVAVGGPLVLTSPDGRAWTRRAVALEPDFRSVTAIDNRLYATSIGPVTLWASDDGSTWVPATHHGGPATKGGGPGDWRLAATPDATVWLGSDAQTDAPVAWVSDPATVP